MSSAVDSNLNAYPPHYFSATPGASTSRHRDVRVKDELDYIIPGHGSPSLSPKSAYSSSQRSPSPPEYEYEYEYERSYSRSPPSPSRSSPIDELQDDDDNTPPQTPFASPPRSTPLSPSSTTARPHTAMPPSGHSSILISTSFAHNMLPPLQPPNRPSSLKSESSPTLSALSTPSSRSAMPPYPSPTTSRRDGPQSPKTPYDANASLVYGHSSMASYSPMSPLPPIKEIKRDTVTTTATQAASANRRRNEAHFLCPVPGCGSTFTRRFNLRGHMRSHLEERPFTCEWPGCGKSFARQHDCKRHTALHSMKPKNNSCKGCGKTFSRLDALNRHLRSEGGADCRQSLGQQLPPLPSPGGAPGYASAMPASPTASLPYARSSSASRHGLYRVKTEPYLDDELLTLAPIRSPSDLLTPASASTERSVRMMDASPTPTTMTTPRSLGRPVSPFETDMSLSPRSSAEYPDDDDYDDDYDD